MRIRKYTEDDWPRLWPVVEEVVRAADTFTYDPAMTSDQGRAVWVEEKTGPTVVAEEAGRLLGTGKMGPNRAGPGSHVATASFMVGSAARGRGVGEALVRYALDWARAEGYAGMQFNAVAASNRSAVRLYERLGFTVVGTIPRAFAHPTEGRVGLHVMYCEF